MPCVVNLQAVPVSGKPGYYDLSCRAQNTGWSNAENAIVEFFSDQVKGKIGTYVKEIGTCVKGGVGGRGIFATSNDTDGRFALDE